MSVINDPIADMLTRTRNALLVEHKFVSMPSSKIKASIAKILKEEGFIKDYEVVEGDVRPNQFVLRMELKYMGVRRDRSSVITGLERISRPGRRIYTRKQDIPWVLSGMGIAILSTPKGLMTGQKARRANVGGELLCKVW